MPKEIPVALTDFGFVLTHGDGLPYVGTELRELPEELRPDIEYGAREDAYHWSSRYVARRAAQWLADA